MGTAEVLAEPGIVLLIDAEASGSATPISDVVPATLFVRLEEAMLADIVRADCVALTPELRFLQPSLKIDPRAQAMVALLRHSLRQGAADALEGESLALTLAHRAVGQKTTRIVSPTAAQARLVERVKLTLSGDLSRRWTLAEIAREVGASPVYLTQMFRAVEGVPLYRHQLGLRLSRALERLDTSDDLTTLALDLGFSSHSHFTTAFTQWFGAPPSAFRALVTRD